MRIDLHTHLIPKSYLDEIRKNGVPSLTLEEKGGDDPVFITGSYRFKVSKELREPEEHLDRMEA